MLPNGVRIRIRMGWPKRYGIATLTGRNDQPRRLLPAMLSSAAHLAGVVLLLAIWRPPALDWTRYRLDPAGAFLTARPVLSSLPLGPVVPSGTKPWPIATSGQRPQGYQQPSRVAVPTPPLPSPSAAPPVHLPITELQPPGPDPDLPAAPELLTASVVKALPPPPVKVTSLNAPPRFADPLLGPVLRIQHPATATFDVVVQSSALETPLPRPISFSPGPVYTVHLPAGDGEPGGKSWMLHYAKVHSTPASTRDSGPVVRLAKPAALTAPYPLTAFRPPICFLQNEPALVVHARITARGHFDQLEILNSLEPAIAKAMTGWLLQWEFRPATEDGIPIEVDVLLWIPGDLPGLPT